MRFRGLPVRLSHGLAAPFSAVVGLPLAETAGLLQAAGYPFIEELTMKGRFDRSGSLSTASEAAALMVDGL